MQTTITAAMNTDLSFSIADQPAPKPIPRAAGP